MSTDQTRRTLNQVNNEIATLEKKSADLAKKEATARSNAARTMKSIAKNASVSTLRSKQSQIDRYNNEAIKAASDKADNDKKIAVARKKQADTMLKLQNEEAGDRKKAEKAQNAIQQSYENRINELSKRALPPSLVQISHSSENKAVNDTSIYDVFVSHAWEDKNSFVTEFVDELTKLGIKAWYDKDKIGWGDSMRAKIDEGLRKSKFGLVVISPNYIAEGKYWTKAELDGLFQLESVNGKTILPIWHNITKKEVMDYSPLIAGRLAMTTASMTPKEIANEIVELFPTFEIEVVSEEQAVEFDEEKVDEE